MPSPPSLSPVLTCVYFGSSDQMDYPSQILHTCLCIPVFLQKAFGSSTNTWPGWIAVYKSGDWPNLSRVQRKLFFLGEAKMSSSPLLASVLLLLFPASALCGNICDVFHEGSSGFNLTCRFCTQEGADFAPAAEPSGHRTVGVAVAVAVAGVVAAAVVVVVAAAVDVAAAAAAAAVVVALCPPYSPSKTLSSWNHLGRGPGIPLSIFFGTNLGGIKTLCCILSLQKKPSLTPQVFEQSLPLLGCYLCKACSQSNILFPNAGRLRPSPR